MISPRHHPLSSNQIDRSTRLFSVSKDALTFHDFSDLSSYFVHDVRALSYHDCESKHSFTLSGNYFTGRVVLCILDRKFSHDLTFYAIDANIRDDLKFLWVVRSQDVLIVPAYYSLINDHVDDNIRFSWSGNKICFSNSARDRMIDSLSSWPASVVHSSTSIRNLTANCSKVSYVLYNTTLEIDLCKAITGSAIEFKPVVFKRYCVVPRKAEWKFVQISFEFKNYLGVISAHIKEEYFIFLAYIREEIGVFFSYIFSMLNTALLSLFDELWINIDAFNEKHYLFEYLLLFTLLAYRSGSAVAAIAVVFILVWCIGFIRH